MTEPSGNPSGLLHACHTHYACLWRAAKTPVTSDKIDAPAACAVPFRPYCGCVVTQTQNISEYMLVLALCLVQSVVCVCRSVVTWMWCDVFVNSQGSVAIAGAAVAWLRDNIGIIQSLADIGLFSCLLMIYARWCATICFNLSGNVNKTEISWGLTNCYSGLRWLPCCVIRMSNYRQRLTVLTTLKIVNCVLLWNISLSLKE